MAWIKLHSDLLDSHSFANPNELKIWIWLLLKANYKDSHSYINIGNGGKTIEIKRGQLVFGRFKAEQELNINGSAIYRILHKLQENKQIKIESNSHYSLITICKYDTYQSKNEDIEQLLNNTRTTLEQHVNNTRTHLQNNRIIEYKEEIESIVAFLNLKTNQKFKPTSEKTISLIQARLKEDYTIDDFKKIIEHKSIEWDNGKMKGYLRPLTLFAKEKFESYLQAAESQPKLLMGDELKKTITWSKPQDITREQLNSLDIFSKQCYNQKVFEGLCKII